MDLIDVEEFDEASVGIVEDCGLTGSVLYEELQQHVARAHRGRQLSIRIIDSPEVNAQARCDRRFDVVQINLGLIQKIYGTMHGLMSLPFFLPKVGDSSKEILPHIHGSGFCSFPMKKSDFTNPTFAPFSFPQDQTRFTFATALAETAIEFVVFHELGHLLGGHVSLLQERRQQATLSEFSESSRESDVDLLRHLMECDADAFAAHFQSRIASFDQVGDSLTQVLGEVGWDKNDVALSIYLVAVAATFRILFPNASFANCRGSKTHPHPAVRSMLVCSASLSQIPPFEEAPARVERVLPRTAVLVERAWQQVFLSGTSDQLHDDDFVALGTVSNSLFDEYLKFRTTFANYSRLTRNWDAWVPNAS